MEIRQGTFIFSTHSGSGPLTQEQDVAFDKTVDSTKVAVFITGNTFGYNEGDGDEHLGMVTIQLEKSVLDNIVKVKATFGVRDWSTEPWSDPWDDEYEGSIDYVVIAEYL